MEERGHKLHGVPRGTSHGHRLVAVLLVIFQPMTGVEADGVVLVLLLLLLMVEMVVMVVVMIHDEVWQPLMDGRSL